jgi:ribosomal protein S6--L-glutamate ligase
MRLWILSHLTASPGNRLVAAAAARAGHDIEVVHPRDLCLHITSPGRGAGHAGVAITGGDAPRSLPDVVFTRIGSSAPAFALDALRQLEGAGVPCVNSADSLSLSRDKLRTFQALAHKGLPLPATCAVSAGGSLAPVLELLGDGPWIIKRPVSTQGVGVVLAETRKAAESVIDAFREQLEAATRSQSNLRPVSHQADQLNLMAAAHANFSAAIVCAAGPRFY